MIDCTMRTEEAMARNQALEVQLENARAAATKAERRTDEVIKVLQKERKKHLAEVNKAYKDCQIAHGGPRRATRDTASRHDRVPAPVPVRASASARCMPSANGCCARVRRSRASSRWARPGACTSVIRHRPPNVRTRSACRKRKMRCSSSDAPRASRLRCCALPCYMAMAATAA